jgi:hypothetical protein
MLTDARTIKYLQILQSSSFGTEIDLVILAVMEAQVRAHLIGGWTTKFSVCDWTKSPELIDSADYKNISRFDKMIV